jgi:nicotinamide-nucleotide amidase
MAGVADEDDPALLVDELAAALMRRERWLVTAESCTGGWVAKVCTDLPGSSRWYRGGVVSYSNDLKIALLGVRPATLELDGAVSESTVREMARGALERLGGDVAVAVSGVAGPDGGTPDKPVGTVWFAWASREPDSVVLRSRVERFNGDRDRVRRLAVRRAVEGLLEMWS